MTSEKRSASTSALTPEKQALVAVRRMRAKLETFERARNEPIAIVGLGCRFPGGARDAASYWKLLSNGVDAITEVPSKRFHDDGRDPNASGATVPSYGGFLEGLDRFDAAFFGISPKEAAPLDPQQRLVLECSWEALEHAGIAPDRLAGSPTGVFMGVSTNDYAHEQVSAGPSSVDPYFGTGVAVASVAGRVSYVLGLSGPSLVVDTACSSSLVSVHLACQALRAGECDMALAGGVNVMISPEVSVAFSRAGMMAADGRCKTFDASADGYVRGEGCGVVVLKRLSDALESEDRILALVRSSAVNQDGRSSGFTVPSELAQQAVIRRALERAGVAPARVDYVEAHGTGTRLGDPIELQALAAALGEGRERPLLVGSVKTNVGHLEAAAGIAGLIKVVLALEQERLPPHVHFKEPNPLVAWDELPVAVSARGDVWPRRDTPRIAGVSSFGFTGTNAHVLVEEAPETAPRSEPLSSPRPHVLPLSAKTDTALVALAERYRDHLSSEREVPFGDVCFTAGVGRARFGHRLAVVAAGRDEAEGKLRSFVAGESEDGIVVARASRRAPKIAFLFSGQGSQYPGMGRELFESEPTFREALEHCCKLFEPHLERSLLSVLHADDTGAMARLDETAYAQPALFALGYALTELWRSFGVEPAYVMGHSVGEYAAAWAASVLDLESAVDLVAARGRLMQSIEADGVMAAVFCDEASLSRRLAPHGDAVSIAAVNGPANVVLSGPRGPVREILAGLESDGISSRELSVTRAFHSSAMDPILDAFEEEAIKHTWRRPRVGVVSNVSGELASEELTHPAYWRGQIREPVRFQRSVETLVAKGVDVFLELGPGTTLATLARDCAAGAKGRFVGSLAKGRADQAQLLRTLATLWSDGVDVAWDRVGGSTRPRPRRVALPTYPFERESYWIERHGRPSVARDRVIAEAPVAEWLYEIVWREADGSAARLFPDVGTLTSELPAHLEEIGRRHEASVYEGFWPGVQSLSALYICRAFEELGLRPRAGERFSTGDTAKRLGIVSRHDRLWERLLEILAEDGLLEAGAQRGEWQALGWPDTSGVSKQADALERAFPQGAVELRLLRDCAERLAPVLRGESNPLEILFPGGELSRLEELYQGTPSARTFNALTHELLARALSAVPSGAPLRVLELGAGTGGTTASLLPLLPPEQTEYVFTDVSTLFLDKAKEKFENVPFVSFAALDLERDPEAQGFRPGHFDVVLAANVLHATRDLSVSLAHARSLLAPSGLLVLLEVVEKERFSDLTVGLTEGWWRFDDDERRDYPALSRSQWCDLLVREGFADPRAFPRDNAVSGALARQALVVARRAEVRSPRRFVLLDGEGELARQIQRGLEAKGHEALAVPHDVTPEARDRLLDEAKDGPPLRVVHLGALDEPNVDPVSQCASLAGWLRALAGCGRDDARLSVVTRTVQPVSGPVGTAGLSGSALWGLGRTAALEHPNLWGGLVDVSDATDASELEHLMDVLEGEASEDQVALRSRRRYVPRLRRAASVPEAASLTRAMSSDASYLVTGGLGVIGCELARWLFEHGAGSIVLTTRREIPAPEAWDEAGLDPRIQERLRGLAALRREGAAIDIVRADVADRVAMEGLVDTLDARGLPLRGVFHLAGDFPDLCDVSELGHNDLSVVLRPKIDGARNLHEIDVDRNLGLEPFVLFSSAAAVWGAKGLGAYAAANHYLDSLAQYRSALGLSATSVNWARWGNTRQEWERYFEDVGLRVMPTRDALGIMSSLMSSARVQQLVASIDWGRFRAVYEAKGRRALLDEITERAEARSLTESPSAVEPGEPDTVSYLQASLKAVLGLDPRRAVDPEERLIDTGLDSLMAVKLKNRIFDGLGVDIPVATLLEGTSLTELSRRIEGEQASGSHRDGIGAIESRESFPLSLAQQRLWFLHELEPDSSLYNNIGIYRFTGELDLRVLAASVKELVRRHEILRTRFTASLGVPEQRIDSEPRSTLTVVDLSGLAAEARDLAMERARHRASSRPFDLAAASSLRMVLLRAAARDHVFVAAIHHIASDGWSFTLLLDELQALYESFHRGQVPSQKMSAIQYGDYASWQRRSMEEGVLTPRLGYWREKLRGPLPELDLPLDRPRPRIPSFRGRSARLELGERLSSDLRALGRKHGATLFMTLLSALVVLLRRTSGQEDVLVGSPTAGRDRSELKNLIGVFVNHLVLRTDVSGRPSFSEVLTRVRTTALEAYQQEVPFEKLLEEVAPERDLSRTPLFQVYFNLLNLPEEPRRFAELTVAIETPREVESKFDLTFYAVDRSGGIVVTPVFNADLFETATIEAMLADYAAILDAAVVSPELPIHEIRLRPEAAERVDERVRRRLLVRRRSPPFEENRSLVERFERQVADRGEHLAVVTRRCRWSYAELNRRANAVAGELARGGSDANAPVGLLFGHDAPMLLGVFGALKASRTYVPLDPSYPEERLAEIVTDAGCARIVTETRFYERAERLCGDVLDAERLEPEDHCGPVAAVDPGALAYILYTSGSTGKPKGVMQSYRNLLHHARRYTESLAIEAGDRLTLLSSFTFDAAVMDVFGALLNGATLVPVDVRADGLDALEQSIRTEAVTVYHSTPTLYRYFVRTLSESDILSTVRAVVLGGEEVRSADLDVFKKHFPPGCVLVNGLGPTESTMGLQFFMDHEATLARDRVPVGYPVEGSDALLLDREGLPNEIFGEVAIQSEHVALGYWNREPLTREAFGTSRNGARWYRTGDMGRLLPGGAIEFIGRTDGHVKIRGYRVEPREVEVMLERHPAVREAIVIAHERDESERELAAFVVARPGASASGEELRQYLMASVPTYMVPSVFVERASIPLTPTGKVDRRTLASELPDRKAASLSESALPRTETELKLSELWRETLELDHVGTRDNFFELGGHSLLATRLASLVRAAFGVELPLRNLFETPRVAEMATWIDAELEKGRHGETTTIARLPREAHRVRVGSRDMAAVAEVLKQRSSGRPHE